jgi:hypothetical protein
MNTFTKAAYCGMEILIDHPTLAAAALQTIYAQLTTPNAKIPLADDTKKSKKYIDKTRYNELCALRTKLSSKLHLDPLIPVGWQLDNANCPQVTITYDKFKTYITSQQQILTDVCPQQILSVKAIITHLDDIFNTLTSRVKENDSYFTRKQPWQYFRADGFESMFFMDLTTWVCTTLAYYDVNKQSTVNALDYWINYCNEVLDTVLLCRFSENEPNYKDPIIQLQYIIDTLKTIKASNEKRIEEKNIKDRIEKIQRSFQYLNAKTFEFLYLLQSMEEDERLDVSELMSHAKKNTLYYEDPNITKFIHTTLGQWLVKTLDTAGIYHNDYNAVKSIDVTSIDNYLADDLANLENIPITQSGLWSFAQREQYKVAIGFPMLSWLTKNTIYFELIDNALHYQVISPKKRYESGIIAANIIQGWGLNCNLNKAILESKLVEILAITHESRHTLPYFAHTNSYLRDIVLIHRTLLLFINLSSVLNYTEARTTSNRLLEQVKLFWKNFYTNHHMKYYPNLDHSNLSRKKLNDCDSVVSKLCAINNDINEELDALLKIKSTEENLSGDVHSRLDKLLRALAKSNSVLNSFLPENERKTFAFEYKSSPGNSEPKQASTPYTGIPDMTDIPEAKPVKKSSFFRMFSSAKSTKESTVTEKSNKNNMN